MLALKEVKKGECFYEYSMGQNIQVFSLEDAWEDPKQPKLWRCKVRSMYGEIEMSQTDGLEHYGPKISRQREYVD